MTEAHKNRNKRSYQKKVNEHRCVTCGKPDERTLSGRVYCQVCWDRHRANASPRKKRSPEQQAKENADKREWQAKCLEIQICTRCGRKDKHTVNGHLLCSICAAKKNKWQHEHWNSEEKSKYYKNRRNQWREQGLCTYCGGKKEEPDKMLCIDCRVRARMRRTKRITNGGT